MAILTREKIIEIMDIQRELVSVPEWGGEVYVRGLNGSERDAFESSIVAMHGKKSSVDMHNIRAKLAAATICGEDGSLMFSEADVAALGKKSAAALDRIYNAATRLSGISEADVDELAKNSNGRSGGSISA